MDYFTKKQEYVSILADKVDPEGDRRGLKRKHRSRNYKPPAIRVPSLVLFGTILTICIILIELVLRHATKTLDSDSSEPSQTNDDELKAFPRQEKRAELCSQLPALIASQSAIETPIHSLCSVFSQSYPDGKRLMPAQVTSFQQWMGSYSQQYQSFEAATQARLLASSDCADSGLTTAPSYDPQDRNLIHYWGCSSTYAYSGCTAYPTITLSPNNSVIAPPISPVCGISTSVMLSLTSQPTISVTKTIITSNLLTLTSKDQSTPQLTSGISTSKLLSLTNTLVTITSNPASLQKVTDEQNPTTVSAISTSNLLTLTSQQVYSPPTAISSPPPSNTAQSGSPSYPTVLHSAPTIVSSQLVSITSQPSTNQRVTAQQMPTVTLSSSAFNSQSSEASQSPSNTFFAFNSQSSEASQSPSNTVFAFNSQSSEASQPPSNTVFPESSTQQVSTSQSQTLYTVATTYTSLIGTTDKNGHTTSISAVIVESKVVTTKPTPSTTSKSEVIFNGNATTTTNASSPIATLSSSEKIMDRDFDKFSYVAALFLPPIIAVMIKVVWEVIYASFKMIEPFHRLSKTGGVTAERSLFAQYLSSSISLDSITSCFSGHTLSMFTTFIYAAVRVLATLAASSMAVRPTARCEVAPNQYMFCNAVWVVNTAVLRSIEIILIACLAITISIIVFTWNYRTGVSSKPSSIASVASLINQDALVYDFRMVNPTADDSELASTLKTRQCALGQHAGATGSYSYGIGRILSPPTYMNTPYSQQPSGGLMQRVFGGYETVSNPAYASQTNKKSTSLLSRHTEGILLDIAHLITSAGLFAVVTGFYFDPNDDAFNRFFNSGTHWARLVMVGIASLVDIQWKRLEREVRFTEPYRRMAKSLERPETTVLMDLNGTCWSKLPDSLVKMLRFKRMWYQTLVSLVAVLSDFNIIAVANVVYSTGLIAPLFYVSVYFVMSLTGLMMLVVLITMFWWRTGVVKRMPRSPDTIGAVFSYLCASRFAHKMGSAQVEDLTPEELHDMVVASGWRFSFKWKIGLDGKERWCVDYEDISPVYEIQQRY